jgi:uncharacterized protein YoaH (UPF0181 family)
MAAGPHQVGPQQNFHETHMITDIYTGQHATSSTTAVAAQQRAVRAFAAHRPFQDELQSALAADPHLPAAHGMFGLAHALSGRACAMAVARSSSQLLRAALVTADGGTPHERALSAALEDAAAGRFAAAAASLEAHLVHAPKDVLALKFAHALRFMTGDAQHMLHTTAGVLPSWSRDDPGFGFVLGCRAFALEETGDLASAEVIGRQAVASEAEDVWGLHAVAHVMEMSGRTGEGKSWLEPARARWGVNGAFGQHLLWHLALFHLAEGASDRALALYDDGMLPARNGDFRDVANAVSLLWRLEQEGTDVGHRWNELHVIAHERRRDCTNVFGSLHYLMALLAVSDHAGADDVLAAMRLASQQTGVHQTQVLMRVGIRLGDAIAASMRAGRMVTGLSTLARHLPCLGGSHAQRDVFLRTLMTIAADAGDIATLAATSALRCEQRAHDRFQTLVSRRLKSARASAAHGMLEAS